MADRIKGITIEIGGDTTGLSKALSGVNREISSTQSQLKDVERLLKMDPKNTELLAQKQRLLSDAINGTREKLETLKTAQRQVQEQFERGEVTQEQYDALQREIIETEQNLRRLEGQAEQTNDALSGLSRAAEGLGKFGAKATDAGKKLLPVTGAITAAGTAASKMAMDFEDAMAKVNTIADTTEVPLDELETAILDLSNQTGISSSEIADNVYNAISAGQKTGDAVNFVTNSTKLARAGFADAGSALDILTTIMNAYGLEASEVNKVSDILIQTQNLGKTTVGELSSAMGKVIPTAKANGVALDQVATGYAIMTANGVATAETTTYMNSMLNELGKSGTKVSETLKKKTGKSFKDLMDGGSSLADVLDIISESAAEQKLSFGDLWSSAEAGKSAMILLGDSTEKYNDTLKQMQNSTGATETAFGKLDTKSYKLQKTVNELKNDAILMGKTILETLAPVFAQLSQKIKELHNWFNQLDESQRETIVKAGLVVAAIGPLLITIGKMSTGLGALLGAVSKTISMLGILGAAGGPVLLAAAALGTLCIVLGNAQQSSRDYYNEARKLTEQEEENKNAVDELYSSYEQVNGIREEAVETIGTQAAREQELWKELQTLVDENGAIKEGEEDRAKVISTLLADALGIEIELTKNQIENYKDLSSSIDNVIQKKQAEALLNASETEYADALKNKTEAWQAYNDAKKNAVENSQRLKEAEAELATAQEAWTAANEDSGNSLWDVSSKALEAGDAYYAAQAKVEGIRAKMDELNGTLERAEEQFVGYNTVIENYEGLSSAIILNDQNKIDDALLKSMYNFQTVETGTRESLKRQHEDFKEQYASMKAAVDAGAPEVAQAQVDNLKQMVDLSQQELNKLPGIAELALSTAAVAAKTLGPDFESAGIDFGTGMADGITDTGEKIKKAAENAGAIGLIALRKAIDSHSPSKETRSIGCDYVDGYTLGIKESMGNAVDAATQLGNNTVTAINAAIQQAAGLLQTYVSSLPEKATIWADDFMGNYISTIHSKLNELDRSCKEVADTISSYLHFTRPDKGPLRSYEEWMPHMMQGLASSMKDHIPVVGDAAGAVAQKIGNELADGLADSIKSNKDYAEKSVEEIAKAVLSEAQKRLKNHQVYNDLSLSAEMDYWNAVRKQVQEGTDARISADEKYFKAKQNLNKKMQSAEEKYTDNIAKAYENLNKEIQKLNKKYRDAVDSRTSQIQNAFGMFDEFSTETNLSSEDLLNNLQSQVDGLKEWRDNLYELEKRGISDDMLQELQDLGPQSAAQVKLLTQMTEDQLDEYVSLFRQKNRIARKQAVDELAPMRADISEQIADLKKQTSKELEGYQKEYLESMTALGVALNQPVENMKLLMARNAVEMVSGLASSIQTEAGNAENTARFKAIAENILNSTGTLPGDMQAVGKDAVAGIIVGLQSKEEELYTEVQKIAQRVTQAMQDTFQIHSPSIVMREKIGKNLMLGLRDGMEKYKKMVEPAVSIGMKFTDALDGSNAINKGTDLSEIITVLNAYLPEIAQQKSITLNGKALVGQTVNEMNSQLVGTQAVQGRVI